MAALDNNDASSNAIDGASSGNVTGLSSVDSPTSGSPPASSAGGAAASNNATAANGIASAPRAEESLSATLERLRLNAQAAKNGAQNGGAGPIGSRDGRGPPPNSRLAKSSLPAGTVPGALSGSPAAVAAAALARGASNGAAAGGPNDPQMSNFLFDDELDNELHNSTYGGRYLQMNADDDKFPVLIRRDSFPGITPPRNAFMRAEASGRTSEWPQFAASSATNTASTATTQANAAAGNVSAGAPSTGASAPVSAVNGANRLSADLSSVVNGARRGGESSPRNRQLPPPRSATTGTSPNSGPGSATAPASATTAGAGATNAAASAAAGAAAAAVPGSAATATSGTAPASERSSPTLGALAGSPKKASAAGLNGGSASPEEMKRKAQLIRERERLERAANGPVAQSPHAPGHKFSDGTPSPAAKYANELAALNGTFSPYPLDGRNGGYGGPPDQQYGAAGPGGYGAGNFNGRRGAGPNGQQQRKEEPNRFAGLRLEDLQGDMAALCKDQHGCRFLQKKLEEGNTEHRDMIFNEIYPHFGELMTDSFGNYLSQKLLEHCSDEQRDALLESISGELVSISLNMHGTRAVQKMIDYLSTQRQVQSLIMALNLNVVTLIKDLNGNHVIQKCLNTLPPEDNQFIYNAVAANCIEVATHRHGCCVLQRCIDHASESQRIQLVTEITYNSLTLVLDPFGNYVVQYVLDLNDSRFITAIVNQFRNNVCALSAQKFSSNVVEKCIRVADLEGRKQLISELVDKSRLERMLRDSFANYVVQTALDYAEPSQRAELVAIIRPVLPLIRNTPYGKRIQTKMRDDFHDGYQRGGHGGHGGGHGGNWHHQPHPGMYGPPMGYYGMPPFGGPGPHGPPHHQGPHHGPPQGYHPAGPNGAHQYGPPPPGGEGHMPRGAGPYGHQYQHMAPPHMASPAVSNTFSPSFGPTNAVPMDYPQPPNYPYL